jgi:outer membrane protein assembly factor BamA
LTTGIPTSWAWSFEGGVPATSTDQDPEGILYSAEGTYTVTLTASNEIGDNTVVKEDYITVSSSILPDVEFEASKYFDLGPTDYSRQRVLALNFWTGTSPSWDEITDSDGNTVVVNKPPFFEGARLGGLYRMRGYPNNRFNDRSVIYTTAEYRYTLKWNPIANISWLRWLKIDWFQLVGFVEGGRVAGEYSLSELFSDWKVDGGIGIRAMMAGAVIRVDMAGSDEGATAWVMFAQPF